MHRKNSNQVFSPSVPVVIEPYETAEQIALRLHVRPGYGLRLVKAQNQSATITTRHEQARAVLMERGSFLG